MIFFKICIVPVSMLREKVLMLEVENNQIKEQISLLKESRTIEVQELKATINRLAAKKKELEKSKEDLEAYTKKTLAEFQEKYLTALQDCKAKLQETHKRIMALDSRNVAESNTQKPENR